MQKSIYESCKICGSKDLQRLFTSAQSGLPVFRCVNCGLDFVGYQFDSAEQQAFYSDVDAYEKFAKAERSVPQVARRHKEWIDQIKKQFDRIHRQFPDAQPRLFDIGCGAGDFLVVAKDQGFQVRGQELSPVAAEIAPKWNNIQVEVKPLSQIETDATDCLTMIGLLEHVISPSEMIEQAYRIIQGRGLLLIYTPVWGAYDDLAVLLARFSGNRFTRLIDRRINQAHLQIFPKETFCRFLQNHGFETISCELVCEYNLPVKRYFDSIGIRQPYLSAIVTKCTEFMIDHKLFFRNNMRVLAQKT